MVWYSHLLKNFPQFVVIHTVKGFSVVNEADIDVFLEFPCFIYDLTDVLYLVVCICQTNVPILPTAFPLLGVHIFVLYIYVSISSLKIGSLIPFF